MKKQIYAKMRSSLSTPLMTVFAAFLLAGGLFAMDAWEMIPMKGQAMPMYQGDTHGAAKSVRKASKSSVRAEKRSIRSASKASKAATKSFRKASKSARSASTR